MKHCHAAGIDASMVRSFRTIAECINGASLRMLKRVNAMLPMMIVPVPWGGCMVMNMHGFIKDV